MIAEMVLAPEEWAGLADFVGMKNPLVRLTVYIVTIALGLFVSATGCFGLIPDQWAEWPVNVWCFALIVYVFCAADRTERIEILTVVAIATPMELFFSEVWKIYEYQRGLMPLFVPLGHYFLFDAGRIIGSKLKKEWALWTLLPFAPFVAYGLWSGGDTSALFMLVPLLCFVRWGPQPCLYAAVVWAALAMELWGTYLANWTWSREVPWTALTAWNPPLLVGSFYCLGDLLVNCVVAKCDRNSGSSSKT